PVLRGGIRRRVSTDGLNTRPAACAVRRYGKTGRPERPGGRRVRGAGAAPAGAVLSRPPAAARAARPARCGVVRRLDRLPVAGAAALLRAVTDGIGEARWAPRVE